MASELFKKVGQKLSPKVTDKEIKCVLVGDNAIGKTKLICSYVYNLPCTGITFLNSPTHTPTIFANDNVDKKTADIQLKHKVGRKNANLVIWDTFGDHEKDREYSYQHADIVLICFNLGNFASLESVASYWSEEVKKFCPGAPVVLVGLQSDRRHNDPSKYFCYDRKIHSLKEYLNSERLDTPVGENEVRIPCVESEIGRKVAYDIGACLYFETSVATRFGVHDLFSAAVQLGLLKKTRASKSEFRAQIPNLLQSPYLKVKSRVPDIIVKRQSEPFFFEKLFRDLSDPSSKLCDVEFKFKDESVFAHTFVMAVSAPVFNRLFTQISKRLGVDDPSAEELKEDLCAFRNYKVFADDEIQPRFHFTMEGEADVFRGLLEFYYTGCIKKMDKMKELLDMASYCQLRKVRQYLFNILTDEVEQNLILKSVLSSHIKNMGRRYIQKPFLADIIFQVGEDATSIPVHKIVLAQRCEVLAAMLLHGNFLENITSKVDFRDTNLESFQSVLEYLYTGECKEITDLHGTLQLANFLCLPHLVTLCEDKITKYISERKESGNQDVYAFVIASFILGEYHNAPQLSAWCLHFMATNYNDLCRDQGKEMKTILDEKTLKYLEENRWPPIWYLKEQDHYERTMQRMLNEENKKKEKKRKRMCSGCF